jgi:transcriptional regulator with XRE-family HTH domain
MQPEQLKEWRARLGLTQVEAAGALRVSAGALTKWEQGRRRVPAWLEVAMRGVEHARAEREPEWGPADVQV